MLKTLIARVPLLGFGLAAVGFSLALATSDDATSRKSTKPAHTVGSNPRAPLFFENAFVPNSTIRDLGDAAVGSTVLRFIKAKGGIPPRRYTSDRGILLQDGTPEFKGVTAFQDAINGLPAAFSPNSSTAVVQLDGRLTGQVGGAFNATTPAVPMDFDVTVTDSRSLVAPLQKTETFQLTMVDSSVFKFAQSALHDGVAYRDFRDKVEMIAGNTPYTYSVGAITVTDPVSGIVTPYASLTDDLGLFLNTKNGRLVGRPLVAGTYNITINCSDKKGAQALSRDKSHVGQTVTFNVVQGTRLYSALFALKCSIKGSVTKSSGDSIDYTGLVDLAGSSVKKLNGSAVTLSIADYDSPTVKLQNGKGSTPKGSKPSMSVSMSPTGEIKISIKGESFGTAGSIVVDSNGVNDLTKSLKILPVMLSIGNSYEASELLKFGVKAKSDKFDLEYKFGPGNLGGGFLITQVVGKDDTSSASAADSWAVGFVTLPHKDQKFDAIATATVGIGTDFTDTLPVTLNNTTISGSKGDATQPQVISLQLDNKSGKGSLKTGPLPQKSSTPNQATAIPSALNANGKPARFPLIVTFNRSDALQTEVFGVEGARGILPKGSSWTSKDLSK